MVWPRNSLLPTCISQTQSLASQQLLWLMKLAHALCGLDWKDSSKPRGLYRRVLQLFCSLWLLLPIYFDYFYLRRHPSRSWAFYRPEVGIYITSIDQIRSIHGFREILITPYVMEIHVLTYTNIEMVPNTDSLSVNKLPEVATLENNVE